MSGPEEMFSVTVVKRNGKYIATDIFGMDKNKTLPKLRSQGPDLLDLFHIYEDLNNKKDYIPEKSGEEPTVSPEAKDKEPTVKPEAKNKKIPKNINPYGDQRNVKDSVVRIEDNLINDQNSGGGASKKKRHKIEKSKTLRKRY